MAGSRLNWIYEDFKVFLKQVSHIISTHYFVHISFWKIRSLQWKYFFSFSSFLWNNIYDFSAFLIQYLKMAFFSSFPSYFRFSSQSGHPELSMSVFCFILLIPTYLCRLVFKIADADFWLSSFMYRLQELEILVQVFWCTY